MPTVALALESTSLLDFATFESAFHSLQAKDFFECFHPSREIHGEESFDYSETVRR